LTRSFTALPERFMYVSGLATFTVPPATRPSPVIDSFSCLSMPMRNFLANASRTIHPALWRVCAYSSPGLPRPTMSFIGGEGYYVTIQSRRMTPTREQFEHALRSLRNPSLRYADIRWTATHQQHVRVRNGEVDALTATVDRAIGVRVLAGNGWGFAATSHVSEEAILQTAQRALEVAAASNMASTAEVVLSDVDPHVAKWASSYRIDPWSIPLQKKIEHLLAATEPMRGDHRIHQVSGEVSCYRQEKIFASTAGSFIEQTTTEMGGGIEAAALENGEFQRRTYPNPFGGDYQAAGWEFIEELDLAKKARQIRDEAIALLTAPKAPAGRFDLIVGSSQLALQVHESCGHPTELDRAMGLEISLAGGSFMQPDMLGTFRYGSPLVNIVADATIPGSIGSFGFDDDGVPAQRFHLIENGIFTGYLTGRDTAPAIGRSSNGTVRAESAARIPI